MPYPPTVQPSTALARLATAPRLISDADYFPALDRCANPPLVPANASEAEHLKRQSKAAIAALMDLGLTGAGRSRTARLLFRPHQVLLASPTGGTGDAGFARECAVSMAILRLPPDYDTAVDPANTVMRVEALCLASDLNEQRRPYLYRRIGEIAAFHLIDAGFTLQAAVGIPETPDLSAALWRAIRWLKDSNGSIASTDSMDSTGQNAEGVNVGPQFTALDWEPIFSLPFEWMPLSDHYCRWRTGLTGALLHDHAMGVLPFSLAELAGSPGDVGDVGDLGDLGDVVNDSIRDSAHYLGAVLAYLLCRTPLEPWVISMNHPVEDIRSEVFNVEVVTALERLARSLYDGEAATPTGRVRPEARAYACNALALLTPLGYSFMTHGSDDAIGERLDRLIGSLRDPNGLDSLLRELHRWADRRGAPPWPPIGLHHASLDVI
jgi:hypothetical protein